MRIFDLAKLSMKIVRSRWAAMSFLSIVVAAFCLCFAGAILTTVQEEKAQPYELIVLATGGTRIGENTISDMRKIPDVISATPILQIPVTIKTGNYVAQLTLTGINADYFHDAVVQGSVFPDNSVMPYILLNESACMLFKEGEAGAETTVTYNMGGSDANMPKIDWLNTSYALTLGDNGRSVISKVCGIFFNGDVKETEPAAYVSLNAEKELLLGSGSDADCKTAWVRITSIGCADAVSGQIATLGLNVTNSNEQKQAEWDAKMKEMIYLLVVAAFCLICAALILSANSAIKLEKQKNVFDMLRWTGMRGRVMLRLFMLHALVIAFSGAVIGILIAMALPSFLPAEFKGCYILSIPFAVIIISFFTCILFGVTPSCASNKHRSQL